MTLTRVDYGENLYELSAKVTQDDDDDTAVNHYDTDDDDDDEDYEEQHPSFYLLEETPDERQRKIRVSLENKMKYSGLANSNDSAAPLRLSRTRISCQPSADEIVQWKQAAKNSMAERNNTSDCVSAMQTIGVVKKTPWMETFSLFFCSSGQ